LENQVAEETEVVAKLERFTSIVTAGLDVLKSDDIATVNAWVRSHIRIYVLGHVVEKIEYI